MLQHNFLIDGKTCIELVAQKDLRVPSLLHYLNGKDLLHWRLMVEFLQRKALRPTRGDDAAAETIVESGGGLRIW